MTSIWKSFCIVLSIVLISACERATETEQTNDTFDAHPAIGKVVPKDSVQVERILNLKASDLVVATLPATIAIPGFQTISPASREPLQVAESIRPGKDSLVSVKEFTTNGKRILAGLPEVTEAKDPIVDQLKIENISVYGKLQGLKHGAINFMYEDSRGEMWFATNGGGVIRYDGKFFTTYTEDQGLCKNSIFGICEDKDGNLWFGSTGAGVSKFDGHYFTNYGAADGISNTVYSLHTDKKGLLWLGCLGSLASFDGSKFRLYTFHQSECAFSILNLIETPDSKLWFGTECGLFSFDGTNFSRYTKKVGALNLPIWAAYQDHTGGMWLGTYGYGLFHFDGKELVQYTAASGLGSDLIWRIREDRQGNIWLATYGEGMIQVKPLSNGQLARKQITEKEGLSNNIVWSVYQDRAGNTWFGTNSGLNRYDGAMFPSYGTSQGLKSGTYWSLLRDSKNRIWAGSVGGGVLCMARDSTEDLQFKNYTEAEGLLNNSVYSILEDAKKDIWLGSDFGISRLHFTEKGQLENILNIGPKQGFSGVSVLSSTQDKQGVYWFGTSTGLLSYDGTTFKLYGLEQGLCNPLVYAVLCDRHGELWIGTNSGLSRMNPKEKNKRFRNYNLSDGLGNMTIRSLMEDKDHRIWIGTYGGGLNLFEKDSLYKITEKQGLLNNFVLSLYTDKAGDYWLGTRFGVSRLTVDMREQLLKDLHHPASNNSVSVYFRNYSYTDGFRAVGVNSGKTIVEDHTGKLWIGGNDLLMAYEKEKELRSLPAPKLLLRSIVIANEELNWNSVKAGADTNNAASAKLKSSLEFDSVMRWNNLPLSLSLPYYKNSVVFHFVGSSLQLSKNLQYHYRLIGQDESWSPLKKESQAVFNNLNPGTFTFEVEARDASGKWSEPAKYTFSIRPPYWQTLWFRALVVLSIVALIIAYIRWREHSLRQKQKELEEKIEEATLQIREQKDLIEEKHQEITDSILYAERIQKSFLATDSLLNEVLPNYFIFFKPRNVVSGDFYWAARLANKQVLFSVADSTGHGVPGAIMSLLNITSLEKAIETKQAPADILNETRRLIIERLKKDGSAEGGKDGMDASLIQLDLKALKLTYVAANNPIWLVRKGEVLVLQAQRMPVGKHINDAVPFQQQEINLQHGDVVYLLSDGFPDQFGGASGKKYMYKRLREFLMSISQLPAEQQKEALAKEFDTWKSNKEQVDDVTVAGIIVP